MNIDAKEFRDMKKFLRQFVSKLDVGLGKTHVGLLIANTKAETKIEISLGQHDSSKALSGAVGKIKRHGRRDPDIGYALELIQNKVFIDQGADRPGIHDVLILLTNKIDASKLEDVLKRAKELKSKNVEIITVAVTKKKLMWNFKDELTAIASIPQNVLTLQPKHLRKLKRTLNRRICRSRRAMHPSSGCTRENHDVFFVLDGSGSISLSYFIKMKHFLIRLIERLDVGLRGTHVGLLQFSHKLKTKIEFKLGQYLTFREIERAINKMPYQEGGTDTGHALETINKEVFPISGLYRPNVSDIVVILTDGEARDRAKALDEAEELRNKGVQIIAVGMGEKDTVSSFRKDLKLMASRSSDVFTADFKKLPYLVQALTSEICNARQPKAAKCSHQKRDVLLVVDGSASVGYMNMRIVKKFLKNLVLELHIGKRRNHIGLVQFSEAAKTDVEFHFNQYYDARKTGRAISRMEFHSGKKTEIGHALGMAHEQIFTGRNGDRPHVDDVMILVADGGAHDKVQALENAVKLKKAGVQIVTIYIPNKSDDKEAKELLKEIASSPKDFHTSNFDELKYIAADLVKVVCTDDLGSVGARYI